MESLLKFRPLNGAQPGAEPHQQLMIGVITDAMRVVGVEAYKEKTGLMELLQDAMAYPLFDGGNVGVRRLQLQRVLAAPEYDMMAAAEGIF